ncbi:MAG: hypothetical protein V7K88_18285 [Nostoc sp.]
MVIGINDFGQTSAGDWMGVRRHVGVASRREVACQQTSQSEFDYNP